MGQNLSLEGYSSSPNQEIPRFSWNSQCNCGFQNSHWPASYARQFSPRPFHLTLMYILILSSSVRVSLPVGFVTKTPRFSSLTYMPTFRPFLLSLISLVIPGKQYKSRSSEQLRNHYKYFKILIGIHLDILDIA